MRIIAGSARGIKLAAPEGIKTRPTTDRIKESLFNMISPDLLNCSFLDLYSGSGSIGLEAVSRGAKKAILVDSSPDCYNIIMSNAVRTKLTSLITIHIKDVTLALKQLSQYEESFDIIFMDPPYEDSSVVNVLQCILIAKILSPTGYIIVESGSQKMLPAIKGLEVFKQKKFKTTTLSFLRIEEELS